jgi:hypothetical protein
MLDVQFGDMPVRSVSLEIPRTTESPRITASPAAYRRQPSMSISADQAISGQMDFPRMTASLMQSTTAPAISNESQEGTAPRKVVEREVRPAVIN